MRIKIILLLLATVQISAYGQSVIVGGTTLNGNFNNPDADSTFAQLVDWTNLGTGGQGMNATKNNNAYDGSRHAVLGYLPGTKLFAMDTGYTINTGDMFGISYVWKDGWKWADGADQVRVSLFVTDNNTIGGVRTDLAADLSGFSTVNSSYEAVNHAGIYEASAADTGKVLFVAIDTVINDESYAHLDNFELTVLTAGFPASPSNLVVAAGDSNIFLAWAANSEANLAGYNVYRSTVPGSYGAPMVANLMQTEFFDESVTNGTPCYYRVTAVNTAGNESAMSSEELGIPMAYPIFSAKKGVGNASGNKLLQKQRVEGLHASWYYAWSMDRNFKMNANIEFAPMRHSKWWPSLSELAHCGTFTNMLTWNEPYKGGANDPTPTNAVVGGQYQDIVDAATLYGAPGTRIGSPTFQGTNDWWQLEFMPMATAANLQIDFITCHRYPNPNQLFNRVKKDCDELWTAYGKPIWVTEFNGADWQGTGAWTMADTYTTMIELLYYFESTPYVERYAVFPWDLTWEAGAPSHIFEVDIRAGQTNTMSILTPLGKLYAEYRSIDIGGPYAGTWYHLHNRGGKKRLMNSAGAAAMTTIDTDGPAVQFEWADAGGGHSYIVNRGTGERLAYNGSLLSWTNAVVGGSSVEWTVSNDINGWDLIDHPATGRRLRGSPLGMASAATLDDTVRWSFVRAAPLPSDLDSDELPDRWEAGQFGSLVASSGGTDNFDGDIHSDREEYIAGTLAYDPNSYFQSTLSAAGGGTLGVSFLGVSNRTYILETTESLTNTIWNAADAVGPLPTNGIQVLQHTEPGSPPSLFGRIRISL